MPSDLTFVYLSPTLEFELQVDVDFIVAHELAHLVLGHGRQRQRDQTEVDADENAADELVCRWGYLRRDRRDSRFLKLLEKVEGFGPSD